MNMKGPVNTRARYRLLNRRSLPQQTASRASARVN
jgi:hypothetical protein